MLRSFIKSITPEPLQTMRKRWIWAGIRKRYSALSVAQAFQTIYHTKAWGEAAGEAYCSGFGSDLEFAQPYAELVREFISSRGILRVLDLGCGDFRVGRLICNPPASFQYLGYDVVEELTAYNHARFGRSGVEFRFGNIIEDELPDADLCLIRQVLQHLSNLEIARVLSKCAKYRFVLVTEEVYTGSRCRPNRDKPHGPDNRLYDRSGVYLDRAPFNQRAKPVLELQASPTSVMRTSLIENSCPSVFC
jgi:SAM-dependent methyltransferase